VTLSAAEYVPEKRRNAYRSAVSTPPAAAPQRQRPA
jgi:hypothetical protein